MSCPAEYRRASGTPRDQRNRTQPAFSNPKLALLPAESAYLPGFDGDYTEALVPASFTSTRLSMRAAVEVPHCLRKVPQCLLLHHLRTFPQPGVLLPCIGKLAALLEVAGHACASRPVPRPLLDRKVPYVPGVRAVPPKRCFLSR